VTEERETIFDDFPRGKGDWFPWTKAVEWRRKHEAEILDAMEALAKLKTLKTRWVEHIGCSGDCASCNTPDWCLFKNQEQKQ